MKKCLLFIASIFVSISSFAQADVLYSRAEVNLGNKNPQSLATLGIETDHGVWKANSRFISDFADHEIQLMQDNGFDVEILIENVSEYYVKQNSWVEGNLKDADCLDTDSDYVTPTNFNQGSMGGYLTYDEMLAELDDMVAQFPNLITVKQPLGSTTTIEGRPMYHVIISDNPGMEEGEEEVLYTALHHAREPNSLMQMIFYMWYLLENYDSDSFVQFLVNETELFFVPCVNPDGYIYNETTNPNGGGLWRKNRRVNGDGNIGVDLNRNYGYNWGLDNSGSSPNTNSQVYRGTAAFSEPETQLVRDLVQAHDFPIVMNYHTYGNYLVYPWNYTFQLTEDSTTFREFSDLMTSDNNYTTGTAFETVGYFVNGDSDDWMYGAEGAFAMTPESGSGSFGFWPPASEIENICEANMWQNLSTAALVHNFGQVVDQSPVQIEDLNGNFNYSIKRYGLLSGILTVSIEPVSSNIISVGPAENYDLQQFESVQSDFAYTLNPATVPGEIVSYNLVVNNGSYDLKIYVEKVFGAGAQVFNDPFNNLSQWNNGGGQSSWSLTNSQFHSAPNSTTDSQFGDYPPNVLKTIELAQPVDLSDGINATLKFWAKWDIEPEWDYVQVQASSDGISYSALCGRYTIPGSNFQDPGEPIFDDYNPDWVQEEMDLSPFVGGPVYIKYILVSDGGVQEDGYYFDDVEIEILTEGVTSTVNLDPENFVHSSFPNPASLTFTIEIERNELSDSNIRFFNSLGQTLLEENIETVNQKLEFNVNSWAPGVYFYEVFSDKEIKAHGKVVVAH